MDTSRPIHRFRLQVRGYELDSYRHVNHAVYLSYLEQARWNFLSENGLSLRALDDLKRWPVVLRAEIDYRRSALMDDELEIRTQVSEIGRSSFKVKHEMVRLDRAAKEGAETRIVDALITAAIIDDSGRAVRVPPEFQRLFGVTPTP